MFNSEAAGLQKPLSICEQRLCDNSWLKIGWF